MTQRGLLPRSHTKYTSIKQTRETLSLRFGLATRKSTNVFWLLFPKECSPQTNQQGRLVDLVLAWEVFSTPVLFHHCLAKMWPGLLSISVWRFSAFWHTHMIFSWRSEMTDTPATQSHVSSGPHRGHTLCTWLGLQSTFRNF